MIHSLFIINSQGDVFLEKHWRSVISRSVCDYYLEAQRANGNDINPVIATPHHYLISIQRGGVSFVAVCMEEIPPLFVIEFLHRVVDTFQLLDEMLDNGFPLATESNILKELIKPPNILRTIANTVTGKTKLVKGIDMLDSIDCCIKLSGMPDLTLSFINPRLFDDVSFHPCVRFKRWEAERLLSFIPPDGNFRLISYHISSQSVVAIPIYVRHNLSIKTGEQARLDLTVGPKQTLGRTVEGVKLEVLMPKCILNCVLTANQGKYNFDPVSKILHWDIGKIDFTKLPNIRGSVSIASGSNTAEINPSINVHFTISQLAVSGLKVNRLDMYGEKYKPFKGVKYITKAGRFQIRM
ncbi:hypothetical protein NQ314_013982 [Rhamnusium bicolor]|uniref:MHD domain-containing protein n=1 Tax=Rhamnusium bicolor TaxID=1586634 RepID=A0AAV8X435_9CUCU|nr:hypothetical protein NQ314_013982 [Rhamnusium bicolor]